MILPNDVHAEYIKFIWIFAFVKKNQMIKYGLNWYINLQLQKTSDADPVL